ncbi:hypothetical protein Y11_24911 [Yersinia enterocolitica subsp. palearctica Y11]|uniref:Uncharacterized protein n=1 Tax=Yersinia enterocolitica subsp. palearctica serotype O:3 (strain DSM 13030 / CIP 106945 / Y11) TaxID=930944 RepID=A0A0H3NXM3_YERE1|nr:hypothetical protein Y11_24911 [Yersinia enterocolitica subsp. palearctica Y11]CCO70061.1 hypothetical protein D322_3204 [Yersinia enterocolitica IP 10393]
MTDFTKLYEMLRVSSLFSLPKNAGEPKEGGIKKNKPGTA